MILMQEVLDATPKDARDLPSRYTTMASLHSTRYLCFGGPETRDAILTWMQRAVAAGERLGDPDLPAMQNSLALQYFNRYIWLREESNLDSALQFSLAATRNTPDDHFSGAQLYMVLAEIYSQKFALDHEEATKKLTFEAYRYASRFTGSNPDAQWQLARKWAHFADSLSSSEALDAYTYAFGILPALLWLGTNITTRHEALIKYNVAMVSSSAIVSCIENGDYGAAVEFLEQSLSITLYQLLDLQTDLSLLEAHHPVLAGSLNRVSMELQQVATSTNDASEEKFNKSSPQNSNRMRKLPLERDALPEQIRNLPNFEHFLLPLPFSSLRGVAVKGPVVIISCTAGRCDALIILDSHTPVLHLRLLRVNADILHTQHERLKKALKDLGIHTRDLRDADRAGRIVRQQRRADRTLLDVLEWLHFMITSPIYDVLRNVRDISISIHIFTRYLLEWNHWWKALVVPDRITDLPPTTCCRSTERVYPLYFRTEWSHTR